MPNIATRRHTQPLVLVLLAVLLIFPPLTSVVADGLAIELAHHHCHSHDDDLDHHGAATADPFQCDQCHMALAAMMIETTALFGSESQPPEARPAGQLLPVRAPPVFKPPIV